MAEITEEQLNRAKITMDYICKTLSAIGLEYEKDDESMSVGVVFKGKDIPIYIRFKVNPAIQTVSLYSGLPFITPEDKRFEMAYILNYINNTLVDGYFAFHIPSGKVAFCMSNSYFDSLLNQAVFSYMFQVSASVVDSYNDTLQDYAEGRITFEQLVEKISN